MADCNRVSPEQRAMIEREALANGLDPDFVEAVAIQESGGDGMVNWDVTHVAHGLMQISGDAATEMGYRDPVAVGEPVSYPPGTLVPSDVPLAQHDQNIHYATKYLARPSMMRRCQGGLPCRAAAYNGGSPIRAPGGGYKNQAYADSVMRHYRCIKNRPPTQMAANPRNLCSTGKCKV